MILTKEQQAILDGEKGETLAKVMKTLVMYGEAFDDECYDYEKILKECIIQCKIRR